MYLDLKLTDEQRKELDNKYSEFVYEYMSDKLLNELFKKTLEGQIKSFIVEFMQSPEFKKKWQID